MLICFDQNGADALSFHHFFYEIIKSFEEISNSVWTKTRQVFFNILV